MKGFTDFLCRFLKKGKHEIRRNGSSFFPKLQFLAATYEKGRETTILRQRRRRRLRNFPFSPSFFSRKNSVVVKKSLRKWDFFIVWTRGTVWQSSGSPPLRRMRCKFNLRLPPTSRIFPPLECDEFSAMSYGRLTNFKGKYSTQPTFSLVPFFLSLFSRA